MSGTVLGWLFGGWGFGRASGEGHDHIHQSPRHGTADLVADGPAADSIDNLVSRDVVEIRGVSSIELVHRLHADDRTAFALIYDTLRTPLWRLAAILVDDPDLADDLVQQVFISLWTRRANVLPTNDLPAYLRMAVRRAARYHHRHARVVARTNDDIERGVRSIPAIGQREPLPDEHVYGREFVHAYERALTSLTERQRTALQLRLERDMTFDEIGRIMEISKIGARKLVLAAEARVQALLGAHRP